MTIQQVPLTVEGEKFPGEFDILTDKEIKAGGAHRSDEDNNIYWLDLHQLAEYERADLKIKLDDEFWAWFKEFRDRVGLVKKRGRVWEERSFGSSFSSKGKDYVSKWWNDWGWTGSKTTSNSDELARRLAIALQAVTTTVRVINETGKPWSVRLASKDVREAPTSYTNFDDRQIVISPQALLDTTIQPEQGIRVTTGYGLHEGSHVEYTEPLVNVIRKPTPLEPLLVASTGLNILEDDRIEALTSDKFPGFARFFDEMLSYLWEAGKDHHPSKWDGTELPNKINCIIAATRWSEEFRPIVDASGDAKLVEMFDWCQTWRDDYLEGRVGPRESLEALLKKLNEDPETQKQCQAQAALEQAQGSGRKMSDEEFEDFLKMLKDGKGILEPCPSPSQTGTPISLTEAQAQQVQDLIEQQLSITQTKLTFPDAYAGITPWYVVTKPKENEESRDYFTKPKASLVERMRNAFFFRRPKMAYAERMLRSGAVDEDGLWRVADDDYRVFERFVQDPERSTAVTMLIDSSGSMAGRKLMLAQELAVIMLECLKTMTGVRVNVRAHTSDSVTEPNGKKIVPATNIYRIWEPGDPIQRLGILNSSQIDHNANWDGFSIQWCLEEMTKNARPDEQQLLIVISDGLPNGDGKYSGGPAMKHMRRVVDHFEQQTGVMTVQIAIDPYGLDPESQAKMFHYWIPFESQERLPLQLTNLLIKIFGGHQ